MDENWSCEAYGPDGADVGALCFLAEQDERACISRLMCHLVMRNERQQIFSRINELAAAGDPVGTYLAEEITSPGQTLNADG